MKKIAEFVTVVYLMAGLFSILLGQGVWMAVSGVAVGLLVIYS
jgi:hypothetical protein